MKLEADFTQYYHSSLQDFYDPLKPMNLRWVTVHAVGLPQDSRVKMACRKDNLTQDQHISLDIIDLLNHIDYITTVHLRTQISKESDFKKVLKAAPKPIERRNEPEKKKEKPAFISGRQLREMMHGAQSTGSIAHTNGCIKSKLYASTGKCGCPTVEGGKK